MINSSCPIGVIDTGVGGLTVVNELQKLLPSEDIIYFGDSKNCPYGNREKDSIVSLTKDMLTYLKTKQVKAVAIACNTISTVIEEYQDFYDYNIIGIVSPAADYVVREKLNNIGVIATAFTIKTKCYNRLINEQNPDISITGQESPLLAALVDRGDFNQNDINTEIRTQIDKILAVSPKTEYIILGCTHYPIIEKNFKECYPSMKYIDPAFEQANSMKKYLQENNLLNPQEKGTLKIYTSGEITPYITVAEMLDLKKADDMATIDHTLI